MHRVETKARLVAATGRTRLAAFAVPWCGIRAGLVRERAVVLTEGVGQRTEDRGRTAVLGSGDRDLGGSSGVRILGQGNGGMWRVRQRPGSVGGR
jgi:hypothetical protein